MLRTVQSLPLTGPSTRGFNPARFQTEPPVCYRASWQLPGPDFHRQATTSCRQQINRLHDHPPICWAHEKTSLVVFETPMRDGPVVKDIGDESTQLTD